MGAQSIDINPGNAVKVAVMVIAVAFVLRTVNRATGLNLPTP